MKFIIALSIIFSLQATAASTDPLLRKSVSSGASHPMFRSSRVVEVFADGKVHTLTNKKSKITETNKGPLSEEIMQKVKDCKAKMAKVKEVEFPNCAGGASTTYSLGSKRFYVRYCGEIAKVNLTCVNSMMDLLDRF